MCVYTHIHTYLYTHICIYTHNIHLLNVQIIHLIRFISHSVLLFYLNILYLFKYHEYFPFIKNSENAILSVDFIFVYEKQILSKG